MNKLQLFALLGLMIFLSVSCSSPKASNSTASADSTTVQKDEPISLGNGYENLKEVKMSGHDYRISIRCVADKQGAVVEDDLGQKFYDNRVEVSIVKDGTELLKQSFSKTDFSSHLSESSLKRNVLQGMNFYGDKSDASYLYFTALVGEPGMDGGSAFLVKVSTENGSFSIEKDSEVFVETAQGVD